MERLEERLDRIEENIATKEDLEGSVGLLASIWATLLAAVIAMLNSLQAKPPAFQPPPPSGRAFSWWR